MGIRPEDVNVLREDAGDKGVGDKGVAGEVYIVEPLGRDDLVDVQVGEEHIHVLANPDLGLKIGDKLKLDFNTEKIQFFDPETQQSLLWN